MEKRLERYSTQITARAESLSRPHIWVQIPGITCLAVPRSANNTPVAHGFHTTGGI